MKVIAINGSPKKDGNTATVLAEMAKELQAQDIEVEIVHIGGMTIHGCIACNYCWEDGHRCVFKDDPVNEISEKIERADGVILASPTYYSAIAGTMKSFLDRLFYSSNEFLKFKVATVAAVTRRAGAVLTANQMKNYLDLAEAITPPSQYWEIVYGTGKGEVLQDAEGMQTARKNARAMAWLMKVVEDGKKKYPLPEDEERAITNFIR
ncbi:flavodoxin family protein [Synergistaceae bacterium OttesenSCG-928-D05]|nr:flavodoxin family protein [Synergistaceae bacterium OttesenSCG-928-D05]